LGKRKYIFMFDVICRIKNHQSGEIRVNHGMIVHDTGTYPESSILIIFYKLYSVGSWVFYFQIFQIIKAAKMSKSWVGSPNRYIFEKRIVNINNNCNGLNWAFSWIADSVISCYGKHHPLTIISFCEIKRHPPSVIG
jgi:hypothetical protein